MEIKLKLSPEEHKELVTYCNLNDLLINSVVKESFKVGFNIERYGLLNPTLEKETKIVEKEVIKYIEVPKVEEKEIIKIEYVEVEKPVEKIIEVIKEIPSPPTEIKIVEYVDREVIKEVPVEKIVNMIDNSQVDELIMKIKELENRPPQIVEVIKEVVIEKQVESDEKSKLDALQKTVMTLRQDNIQKDLKIKQLEKTIEDIQSLNEEKKAVYLKGSNLGNKL